MDNETLIKIAINAKKNSYANVTNYSVGAALLSKSGTIYIGANIEEPSIIGLSNCAERVAIQNAFSHGEREFEKIAIVGSKNDSEFLDDVTPCGVCLQYILDMCDNVEIITIENGEIVSKNVKEYLSSPFELDTKQ